MKLDNKFIKLELKIFNINNTKDVLKIEDLE